MSAFYESDEWRELRYRALRRGGGCCQCCGARATKDNPLHVDHIKPRSKYPRLALELSNLQILCKDCNLGKRAWDETDWRTALSNKTVPTIPKGPKYLVRIRGSHPRAHIIVNGDTACRMYSSGGITANQKYQFVDKLRDHHRLCTLCMRSVFIAEIIEPGHRADLHEIERVYGNNPTPENYEKYCKIRAKYGFGPLAAARQVPTEPVKACSKSDQQNPGSAVPIAPRSLERA